MVAKKTPSPAFEYVVQFLRDKPQAEYSEVRAGAEQAGFRIYPIVFGRAKAHLKLVPVAPRGTAKAARARSTAAALGSVATAHGAAVAVPSAGGTKVRTKATAAPVLSSPMQSLEAVLELMRAGELERKRYRDALEQISKILQSVL